MRRAQRISTTECEWILVSERHPCPLCGAVDGCLRASDAEFACCARRPSDWRLTNGSWLHRLASLVVSELTAADPAETER